jgi:hypothetical protein
MSANVGSASAPIAIRSSPPLQSEEADENASESSSEGSRSRSSSEASSTAIFGPAAQTHTLEEAITSATLPRLRTVLLKMCRQDPVCVALASKELLVEAIGGGGSDATTTKKRHRKAYEVCGQCNVEYDVEENEMRAKAQGLCKYHPGMCSAYTVRLEKSSIIFEIIFLVVGRGIPRGVEFPSKSRPVPPAPVSMFASTFRPRLN